MPKIAAPTSSFRTPRISRPSNLVRSTTTSSGTRKILPTVIAFGRFILGAILPKAHRMTDCHEGHSARRWQGDAPPAAHRSHAEADRADPRSAVSLLPDRSADADPRDRRGDPQPQLPAAADRGDLR